MQRCYNPKVANFKHYGQRGIKVCERWHSYLNFLADMGRQPMGLELERKDHNGNYELGNCRWATEQEQANNRRSNRHLVFGGEKLTYAQWSRRLGISQQKLNNRLRLGWSVEEIMSGVRNGTRHYFVFGDGI